ncbi:regulatory protein RecX [Moraxella catarrhalis]|nr:regulatory protein RecX [Moraxella catarrhalis]
MKIKTLSEVLAEMGESPVSADSYQVQVLDETNFEELTTTQPPRFNQLPKSKTFKKSVNPPKKTSKTQKASPDQVKHSPISKRQHSISPTKTVKSDSVAQSSSQSKSPSVISEVSVLLKQVNDGKDSAAVPPELAKRLQNVAIKPLAQTDKATNYLRWLAFYYLSRREMSRHELQKKLLAKGCEPQAVEDLLQEFAQKGYQSDERFTMMLVRESIRKSRGKNHILQALKSAKVTLPEGFGSIDQLIQQAGVNSLTDNTILADDESGTVDWLKLAVEARTRKYGDTIPTTPKDKAKQLRFLQYRGFEMSVSLEALKYTLADLDELID